MPRQGRQLAIAAIAGALALVLEAQVLLTQLFESSFKLVGRPGGIPQSPQREGQGAEDDQGDDEDPCRDANDTGPIQPPFPAQHDPLHVRNSRLRS